MYFFEERPYEEKAEREEGDRVFSVKEIETVRREDFFNPLEGGDHFESHHPLSEVGNFRYRSIFFGDICNRYVVKSTVYHSVCPDERQWHAEFC